MLVAGIDLAAEPKGTALAILEFENNKAQLVFLEQGLDDNALIDKTINADKVGIDCAFGWPTEFADFIARNQNPANTESINGDIDFRRRLAYRETDRQTHRITGRWPLSVSTDRLGLTAIRCAGLLSKYQQAGIPLDRSGAGKLAEVYPGATLRLWGFDTKNYRVDKEARKQLLDQIHTSLRQLDLGDKEETVLESTDCFDALIAALAARATYLGHYNKPTPAQQTSAEIEGWICLPQGGIAGVI